MFSRFFRVSFAMAAFCLLPAFGASAQTAAAVTPAEARAIAKEAWLYAYAPIQGYQTMYNQTQNKAFPGYVGGFNRFRHYARSATPADQDIVTPNNDTPYSWAWLDLRAEPIVLSLPAVPAPRYYVNQWFDLYTHNFAYTGVRTTGREAGTYLFVGPRWKGAVPKGITKVFRSETDFIGTLTRTQLAGSDDVAAMQAVQSQYKLVPLSQFTGKPTPKPAPTVSWPAWDEQKAEGIGFIAYLNALLPFMPTVPSEKATFARFAKIGIGPGKAFDPAKFDPATRSAIEQGIADASKQLNEFALARTDSKAYFGTREARHLCEFQGGGGLRRLPDGAGWQGARRFKEMGPSIRTGPAAARHAVLVDHDVQAAPALAGRKPDQSIFHRRRHCGTQAGPRRLA